jgi:hypothetical protein
MVSFLQFNKQSIINADHSQIPSILSQLCLKSDKEVDIIASKAIVMRSNSPLSFRLLATKLEIFKPNSPKLKELFNQYNVESMIALPTLPSEVFYIAYNSILNCPDSTCRNFKNKGNENSKVNEYFSETQCYNCEVHTTELSKRKYSDSSRYMSYIILDVRISSEKKNKKIYDFKPGFLPMTVLVDQSELNDLKV